MDEKHNRRWDYCPMGVRNSQDIAGLKEWQRRQNGTLDKINKKLDTLHNMIIAGFGSLLLAGIVAVLGVIFGG